MKVNRKTNSNQININLTEREWLLVVRYANDNGLHSTDLIQGLMHRMMDMAKSNIPAGDLLGIIDKAIAENLEAYKT